MEDNASKQTLGDETTSDFPERLNTDGNSIISTPDKLPLDSMPSVDNLKITTTSLSVLSEKDEMDFLTSSAKTLHKTISDYVEENFGLQNKHFLAQCSYDYSPSKQRNFQTKTSKRQKPEQEPSGKSEPTKPPTECPIKICRPGYKPPPEKRKSRKSLSDETERSQESEQFKAMARGFEFKPSVLTLVDTGPIKVRKIQRIGAKPEPLKSAVKENKSSKLRYEYNRKQATVPSHMQEHLNKFKKPPFRPAMTHEHACFEDIVDRLRKIKKLFPQSGGSPVKGSNQSDQSSGKTKSRKSKTKKR